MERLLNVTQVSELLGYSPDTIRSFVKKGQLKAFRHKSNSSIRFKKQDLVKFMKVSNGTFPPKLISQVKKLSNEARTRGLKKRAKTAR